MSAEAVLLVSVVVLSAVYLLWKHGWGGGGRSLSHIPGPRALPLLGNSSLAASRRPDLAMEAMANDYGSVFRVNMEGSSCVVVCDFAAIYEVLVTKSADFAGRPSSFLTDISSEQQSGILRTDAGPKLHGRRKLMHTYLKQYGAAGMKRIEDVTVDATTDMVRELAGLDGAPVNIRVVFLECVTDIIAIMLTGETFGKEMLDEIERVIYRSSAVASKTAAGALVNTFPFLRYFGNKPYQAAVDRNRWTNALIEKWIGTKPANGFINFVQNLSEEDKQRYQVAQYREQRQVIFNFYLAGVLTTSTTLSVLMNVLCHREDLQEKLRREIFDVIGESRAPSLADRENMPYHCATLLEIGRYASILPLSIAHKTVRDTAIESGGRSIRIPAGTKVLPHLWSLHHSKELWRDPFTFDPDRFLDPATGELVAADHPNRKHVMPFGAGHRGCVGEVFAMSRMFLILSRVVQTFRILPESTLEKQPSHDPRNLNYGTVLAPPVFKIRLQAI